MSEDIKLALVNYIVGNIDDKTKARIEQWIEENPENMQFYIELQEAWNATLFLQNSGKTSVEDAYKLLESKLALQKRLPFMRRSVLYAAAAVVAVILTGIATYRFAVTKKTEGPSYVKSVYVPAGNKQKLVLKDSTVVWLNSGSVLELSSGFGITTRTVYLEGEGYFEVKSDRNPAFVVQTKDYTIRDIGTIFNINTYSADARFEAAVIEGEISIEGKFPQAEKRSKIFLKRNDVLKISKLSAFPDKTATNPIATDSTFVQIVKAQNIHNYAGWKDDLLIFDEETFRDIAKKLERKYKVVILIQDEKIAGYRYSGSFNNVSNIQGIVDILKETTPANYMIAGDTITIESKK